MATLNAGSSVTLGLDAWASVALSVTGKATMAFTSQANNVMGDFTVTNATSRTYGPFGVPMSCVLTAVDGNLTYTVSGEIGGFARDSDGAVTGIIGPDGTTIYLLSEMRQSDGYHFHGWAQNQINSDLNFLDYSGALNDATFQANLAAADAWATAGYLTQADPAGVGNLSLVAIPALTWDYLAGDSLFIFWRGMATPEGSDAALLGNTSGTAANGLRVIVSTAGKLKLNAYQASGTLSRFGGTSTATVFEAAIAHSFALAIDGVTGKHCYWADGVRDAAFSSGFLTFGSGGIIDTVSSTTLKLGGDGATSGSVQLGAACKTQALVILEGRNGLGTPVVADLDLLVANLHRNPQRLVTAETW